MLSLLLYFFFNDTATTEIYTLSLHDALPISKLAEEALRRSEGYLAEAQRLTGTGSWAWNVASRRRDRKSTRLNSSHRCISYAVFCLKKKKKKKIKNK